MCGSGTLVIEAAMIAADLAPNIWRTLFRLSRLARPRGAAVAVGTRGSTGARRCRRRRPGRNASPPTPALALQGADRDGGMLRSARANAERAGVIELTRFTAGRTGGRRAAGGAARGLVCTNPPYGERLEDREAARATASAVRRRCCNERFMGWQAVVITAARKWDWSSACARIAPTSCGMARSNAACCASISAQGVRGPAAAATR